MNLKWISAFSVAVCLHILCILPCRVPVFYKTDTVENPKVVWIRPLKALSQPSHHDPLEHAKTMVEAMLDLGTSI